MRFAASDLVLYSLPMSHKKDAGLIWVNILICTVSMSDPFIQQKRSGCG